MTTVSRVLKQVSFTAFLLGCFFLFYTAGATEAHMITAAQTNDGLITAAVLFAAAIIL